MTAAAKGAHAPAWWETHDELLAFARVLVATHTWSADGLLSYLEKPWHWTADHAAWCALGRPEVLPEPDAGAEDDA